MAFLAELASRPVLTYSWLLALVTTVLYSLYTVFSAILSPSRSIPGPFFARFTRLWYLRRVRNGQFHNENAALHQKYGPIVRIAPNEYSIDDPDAIRPIYGHGTKFTKSDWYRASGNPYSKANDLFTAQNPTAHAATRRSVANLYSTSTLVKLEPFVDECIRLLFDRFTEIAREGKEIDLQFWMQCYAFDVIGYITLGKRFGFLDEGKDDVRIFDSLHRYLAYASSVGVVNELHKILFPVFMIAGPGGMSHIMKFTREQISEVTARTETNCNSKSVKGDFLSRLLEIRKTHPEKLSEGDVFLTCATNIGAGSDTTSISLCAVLHALMTHPETMVKLRQEVEEQLGSVEKEGSITFQMAQKMPYMQACIKEALRLHPATGLPLGRVVPPEGAVLAGRHFPGGTVVGVNTWVAHRNRAVFGADAEQFRPERWLEASKEQALKMDEYYLPFGHGSRTCIGKNISLLEMNKLIPILVRRFDIRWADPTAKLKCQNVWFVKQTNLVCRVMER
ncbi:cytochrome P450 [Pyrenochaeta sp. MPI-SDFR-AT-0127]|nr:cytochrome P450 [Pyrenochaeta sp. MPI-SDFR-AT-0127]